MLPPPAVVAHADLFDQKIGDVPDDDHHQHECAVCVRPPDPFGHHCELRHAAEAGDDRERHEHDVDDRQILHDSGEIVAHNRYARIGHAGQNARIDSGEIVALLVFDGDVVEEVELLLIESDLVRVVAQFDQQQLVRACGALIVGQTFEQREHVHERLVRDGELDFVLDLVGDVADDPQMLQKMMGGVVKQPQQHPLNRVSAQRHPTVLEERHRFGLQHDNAVFEKERADRRHLERHRPIHLKIARPFQYHRNVIAFVFHTGNLIFVECGNQRVLIDPALIDQVTLLLLCRRAVHLNDSQLTFRTALNTTVHQIVTSEHNFYALCCL